MQKIKRIIYVMAFLVILVSGKMVFSAETVAVIVQVKGSVTVTKAEQTAPSQVERGFRLGEGDKLITGDKGFAALRFIDDASLVRIRPNSICTINGKKEKNHIIKNIYVEVGAIMSDVTGQKGRFQVATPTSVASVKGTRWITHHEIKEGTHYFGEEGEVEIANESGNVILGAGMTAYVSSKTADIFLSQTQDGDKPGFEDEGVTDEFKIEFENDSGKVKKLEFKVSK